MLRELVRYYRPGSVQEALGLLQQPHTLVLAGGSELLGRDETTTVAVVDLQDAGLDYVHAKGGTVRIGAMTRLQATVDHPALGELADGLLARSATLLTNTERHAATLGGAVAAAGANSELVAVLLVLEARVIVRTIADEREVPVAVFCSDRDGYLAGGALVSELIVPAQPDGAWFGLERIARTPADRASVCVAARLAARDNRLHAVKIAAGSGGQYVFGLAAAEDMLIDRPISALPVEEAARNAANAMDPRGAPMVSGEYQRAMLGVLLARIVNEGASALRSSQHA